ncbi:MAG: hypothetical protein EU544_05880 [Promethearchaeota archaeon]|nr:MAG: hypothetical protein EU544_05880 [Candidatus Lokiarchaeota archaeon]
MNAHKDVCCWDLEGPISVVDFAAELGRMLRDKSELGLGEYDMGEFFMMISNYDDYLIDTPGVKDQLGIVEYQPGDTLRLMAPFYVACFTEDETLQLAKNNLGLLPGCKELMEILHKNWDIYVISTSYTQFAYNVTAALNIPQDHVYCTDFPITTLKENASDIENSVEILVKHIFQKYMHQKKDLSSVIEDLNEFFWKSDKSDYISVMNQVKVRGGKRKELAVEDISRRTNTPISEMIALGDSITDINMLERVDKEGGIAVSFNGNRFSARRANLAVTTPNNLGVLPVFRNKDRIEKFLAEWETKYSQFKEDPHQINSNLITDQIKTKFIKHNFVPEIVNLQNKTEDQIKDIILRQEKMRKKVRGWAGNLG